MAEVSYLQLHENDDEHDLDTFDWPLSHPDQHPSHVPLDNDHSILFDRENQVNFVIDMFHQSVEQSQSQSRVTELHDPDRQDRNNGDDDSGFMFSDCWDDFFISRTADPGGFAVPGRGSDSDLNQNQNPIPNANDDLEWEEIDAHESEQQPPNALEWEVLLDTHNLETNPDLAEYNQADYEMLFGQFLDNDSSSSGRPPASVTVVENLSTVVITIEDYANRNTLCAVCKDEIGVGLIAKRLPCDHLYHGDCIVPWLEIRNTCPVCRHELLTDDVDYERRKAERGGSDG